MAKKKKKAGARSARSSAQEPAIPILPKAWNTHIASGNLPALKSALESDPTVGNSKIRAQLERAIRLDPVELVAGLTVLLIVVGFYMGSV